MNKYEILTGHLNCAREAAKTMAELHPDDGGTCNFDSMMLSLPRWNKEEVEKATEAAGLRCWFSTEWKCFIFSVPVAAQGNQRTVQAETMSRVMKEHGYNSSVYYQMD